MAPPKIHGCFSKNATEAQRFTLVCWGNMINRCNRPKCPEFKNYGARGIKVCTRWRKYENFFADMGEKPDGLSLERKENNKGYFKDNCYWATREEQSKNGRIRKDNQYGAPGICMNKKRNKYDASIFVNKKRIHIGRFDVLLDAIVARKQAEVRYGYKRTEG